LCGTCQQIGIGNSYYNERSLFSCVFGCGNIFILRLWLTQMQEHMGICRSAGAPGDWEIAYTPRALTMYANQ